MFEELHRMPRGTGVGGQGRNEHRIGRCEDETAQLEPAGITTLETSRSGHCANRLFRHVFADQRDVRVDEGRRRQALGQYVALQGELTVRVAICARLRAERSVDGRIGDETFANIVDQRDLWRSDGEHYSRAHRRTEPHTEGAGRADQGPKPANSATARH